jgi:hypothetical protein
MDNLAWKKALILRGCPPDEILYGPLDEPLQAHIDICPACRERLAMDGAERVAWEALGRTLRSEPAPVPERPAPGQVWRVRAGLAGWGPQYRYRNPPLVLILELPDQDLARVAQLYPGEDFRTGEDIPLPGLGCAQPWNVYSLAVSDLGQFQGDVSAEEAAAVLKQSTGPFADLDDASPLFWFRTMELELGAFFAGQSLAGHLAEPEHAPQRLESAPLGAMTSDRLCHALERKGRVVALDADAPLLQLARYGREGTAWGLAASSERTQAVNYALLDEVGLEIRQASIVFSTISYLEKVLTIGGRIQADFARAEEVFGWWDARERLVMATQSDISPDGRFFHLCFAEIAEREFHVGRLVLLVSGRSRS